MKKPGRVNEIQVKHGERKLHVSFYFAECRSYKDSVSRSYYARLQQSELFWLWMV